MNKVARSNRGKAVLGVQLVHERAWQRRSGLTGNAFKRLGLGQSASNQRLLAQLEAENVQLRGSLVDLMLRFKHYTMRSAIRSLKLDLSRFVASRDCLLRCR